MAYSTKRLYEIYYYHFPHYMLTKNESLSLHLFLLSFAFFVGYGLYSYVPSQIVFFVSRAYYYLFGETAIGFAAPITSSSVFS